MNEPERPRIVPLVLAQLIDAAPNRVRKRLDKEPDVARQWNWQSVDDGWSVSTGEETVTLVAQEGVVASTESVRCSCLLSPRCFHVLACANTLESHPSSGQGIQLDNPPLREVASPMDAHALCANDSRIAHEPHEDNLITLDADKLKAAQQVRHELNLLARVGGRRADLLRQSGLLRAAHGCRATGLVNLGNSMLRIVENIRRLRDNHDTADSQDLAEGLAIALQQTEKLLQNKQVPQSVVGQARREFLPCEVGKLLGVYAEPILTLSGYAGVVVTLQGIVGSSIGKDELFTVSHARPGDSQWVAQSYRGGIDMGNQTLQAAEVCRSQLLVQNLTSSSDGRLGKGTSTRWVLMERAHDLSPLSQGRFGQPLAEQISSIFDSAAAAKEERSAGWDLIAFDAQVIGGLKSSLVVRVRERAAVWKLRIAIDSPSLPFRENLSLLARCPGLVLRCLGRLRLQAAGEVDLLALSCAQDESWVATSEGETAAPRLKLDDAWKGVCNLGFERLQRCHVDGVSRWSTEVQLEGESEPARGEFEGSPWDGLEPLRRRQVAIALGGCNAVAELSSEAHRRDRNQLRQRHQHTAVELLDLLAVAAHERESQRVTRGAEKGQPTLQLDHIYLANHLYLQSASRHFQKRLWQE